MLKHWVWVKNEYKRVPLSPVCWFKLVQLSVSGLILCGRSLISFCHFAMQRSTSAAGNVRKYFFIKRIILFSIWIWFIISNECIWLVKPFTKSNRFFYCRWMHLILVCWDWFVLAHVSFQRSVIIIIIIVNIIPQNSLAQISLQNLLSK